MAKILYSDEVAEEICERIAEGESLRSICKDKHMPSKAGVCKWLAEREDFQAQYVFAREIQAEVFADELINICDDATNDDFKVARLKIDTRKWIASKLKPKKYGDKLDLNADITVKNISETLAAMDEDE